MTSATPAGRRMFVYFAGLGTGPSGQDGFIKNARAAGLSDDHVVLHQCPYPTWSTGHDKFDRTVGNALRFVGSMKSLFGLTRPSSATTHREYHRLLGEMQSGGVRPDDRVTLVAHSAGGQEACMMAKLLENSPYHVDTVVLMASPVLNNTIPTDKRVVAVVNPADPVTTDAGKIPGLQLNGIPKNIASYPNHVVMTISPDPAPHASQHNHYFQPDVLHAILHTANPQDVE